MIMQDKKGVQKLWKKALHKYRFVIMTDDSFEEKLSLTLSRLNIFEIAQKEKIRTNSKDAKELAKLNKQLVELDKKEIALGKLSNSNERPFFLWHLFFKDVFKI